MKVSDIYGGAIKAADLNGQDVDVTITGGELRDYDGVRKIRLSFKEAAPLVCNATNARTIARLHGDELTHWPGKRITLYQDTTTYQGKPVPCIRVRDTVPAQEQPAPAPVQQQGGNGAVRF